MTLLLSSGYTAAALLYAKASRAKGRGEGRERTAPGTFLASYACMRGGQVGTPTLHFLKQAPALKGMLDWQSQKREDKREYGF